MNNIIKEQLRKVRVAVIPPYNDDTLSFIVPRGSKSRQTEDLQIGHKYRVVVDHSLIDAENNWYKTIHGNWNGGNGLNEQALIITVVTLIGKMVKVDAVGSENLFYQWSGFLPKTNIAVIEEIN